MSALTIVLDADNPDSAGTQRSASGTITWSADYDQTNGDSFDPAAMGLETLTRLELDPATDGNGLYFQPELVGDLPRVSKLFFPTEDYVHLKASAVPVPPVANIGDQAALENVVLDGVVDLSTFSNRFVAWGF